MTQRERIYRALSERDEYDLRELVGSINSYSGGLTELEFLPMDELTDWLTNWGEGLDSSRLDDLLRQTRNDEFDERDPYFRFDSWDDPVSSDGSFSTSDIDDIAEYIDDNADDLPYWGLSDGLADAIRDALDDPEDDEDDEDDDTDRDALTPDEINAVLADWFSDCERPLPHLYDALALRCAQEAHPADPCDVRAWAAHAIRA
jgi:hypothetical protein